MSRLHHPLRSSSVVTTLLACLMLTTATVSYATFTRIEVTNKSEKFKSVSFYCYRSYKSSFPLEEPHPDVFGAASYGGKFGFLTTPGKSGEHIQKCPITAFGGPPSYYIGGTVLYDGEDPNDLRRCNYEPSESEVINGILCNLEVRDDGVYWQNLITESWELAHAFYVPEHSSPAPVPAPSDQ